MKSKQNYQDKVVLVFSDGSQNRETEYVNETFEFVLRSLDSMLNKNEVITNQLFIGGSKIQLAYYISGLVEYYNHMRIESKVDSLSFENDSDFDIVNID